MSYVCRVAEIKIKIIEIEIKIKIKPIKQNPTTLGDLQHGTTFIHTTHVAHVLPENKNILQHISVL